MLAEYIIIAGTLYGVRTNDYYKKWSLAQGGKNMVRDERDFEFLVGLL